MTGYRAWRFGASYRDPRSAQETGPRGLKLLLPPPLPARRRRVGQAEAGSRPCTAGSRSSARSSATKNGWERADFFEPGKPWRRAGADQRAFGWTRPPWFERLAVEHEAFRERVGIIDMTSFGKIARVRPRRARLARARRRQPDRPAGRERRLHAVPERPRRDRGGRDRDAARRLELPGRHRRRALDSDLGWLRLNLARRMGRSSSATSAASSP